jgi:hypothetical protein
MILLAKWFNLVGNCPGRTEDMKEPQGRGSTCAPALPFSGNTRQIVCMKNTTRLLATALALVLSPLALGGCLVGTAVSVAGNVVEGAVNVTGDVAEGAVNTTGAVVGAVIPGDDEDEDEARED